MRYTTAASPDGCIAGPSGEYDWISRDSVIDFGALVALINIVLVEPRTLRAHGTAGYATLAGTRVDLFSRTLPRGVPEEYLGGTAV